MLVSDFKDEHHFETFFANEAKKYNCFYTKIPDYIVIKGQKIIAKKRPFDGYLASNYNNIAIEMKMDYNKLKDHQKQNLMRIYNTNGLAVIIRAIRTKGKGIRFRIDSPSGKHLFHCRNTSTLFEWFNKERVDTQAVNAKPLK